MLENDKYMKNAKTKQLKEAISKNLKLSKVFSYKRKVVLSYALSEENKACYQVYIAYKQGMTSQVVDYSSYMVGKEGM